MRGKRSERRVVRKGGTREELELSGWGLGSVGFPWLLVVGRNQVWVGVVD